MTDDDLTPEKERRMTAALLGHRHIPGDPIVEVKQRSRIPKASRPVPHFEISTRIEHMDELWIFDLVSGDQRVEVGREYDRPDALKLQRAIEAMGMKVEWVLSR